MSDDYGRRLNDLAVYFSDEFGGTYTPALGPDGDHERWADILFPALEALPACRVHLALKGRRPPLLYRLVASLHPIHWKSDVVTYGIRFPSAVLDITHDFDSICTEIWERVVNVDGVVKSLLEYDQYRQEVMDNKKRLDENLLELVAILPNIRVSDSSLNDTTEFKLYNNAPLIHANLRANSFTFTRIGTTSVDKAKRILAILAEKEEENNT